LESNVMTGARLQLHCELAALIAFASEPAPLGLLFVTTGSGQTALAGCAVNAQASAATRGVKRKIATGSGRRSVRIEAP
jgi:hypothetical protein